ncbi:hypothetical protein ACQ7FX_13755 [Arthrobacter koreensis]|uniref:hypothetical protein n=1 Tax=Arthrobacter koreensis TaxID=199136 RepID=UPI003D914D42
MICPHHFACCSQAVAGIDYLTGQLYVHGFNGLLQVVQRICMRSEVLMNILLPHPIVASLNPLSGFPPENAVGLGE